MVVIVQMQLIGYSCTCVAGYTGDDCTVNVDDPCECDPNPCENGGNCTELQLMATLAHV